LIKLLQLSLSIRGRFLQIPISIGNGRGFNSEKIPRNGQGLGFCQEPAVIEEGENDDH
jgi:hypothetical protein